MKRWVYFFGGGKADGHGERKDLLGGKGAGLAEMTNLGIPVPPGFTITTAACVEYFKKNNKYPEGLWDQIAKGLSRVEQLMGAKFGDPKNPLLVAVRSGARASMPGMMDTVLNVGLNEETVRGLSAKSGNERFVYDAYRRFISMFGSIVMGIEREKFDHALEAKKRERHARQDTDLSAADLKRLVVEFKQIVKKESGRDFLSDPMEQLKLAINAVFGSWFGKRAAIYRRLHGIPDDWGTAVNVVAMVFGNLGEGSGTGVAFTRDPGTGERRFFGEFLFNAQGEDVVAGIRTPLPIEALAKRFPKAYEDLIRVYKKLERRYRDMLDIEFTVQEGKLYMLQTRVGKRTAAAAVKIAADMVKEKMISKEEAILRVDPAQLDQLLHPTVDPKAPAKVIAKGLAASPGAAIGKVVFSAEEAEEGAKEGGKVILVRPETSPEDIGGMHAAQGILTARGGLTSHAAVVARGMGKPCVAGAGELNIDEARGIFSVGGTTVKRGEFITLNGTTGEVLLGEVPLVEPKLSGEFKTLMGWADRVRRLKVRANADTPRDAAVAREFGAEGIGLCRTEHMFFEGDRIRTVREMILADTTDERKKALAKLLPMQKGDFIGIFRAMSGLPVTIRLLDPPLHEFLPHTMEEIEEIARDMGVPADALAAKNRSLQEFNPMLGHRGCRLAISYPEIYEMQVQAIFEAACELAAEGLKIYPEVMIPLVAIPREFAVMKELLVRIADETMRRCARRIRYSIGTMIELPRAALVADEIAKEAEFFSFGTNDLTQTAYGLSRDDSGRFLPAYLGKGIFTADPFVALDQVGVGELMKIAVERGRKSRKEIKLGICGEHGGEPSSVEFCHRIGLHYVSCSPYRVPIARLAAAQAVLKEKRGAKGLHATV